MAAIQLIDYRLSSTVSKLELQPFTFALNSGDTCAIETDSADSARLFLKALATLVTPDSGKYVFADDRIDFSDYRNLLPYRRRIGYIAPDAAMISNRTVRENLLWGRYYFENSLTLTLQPEVEGLCRRFQIYDQLDKRPAELNQPDLKLAIAIREITKDPALLIMEMPEDFIGAGNVEVFVETLRETVVADTGIVYFSNNATFNDTFASYHVKIEAGQLEAYSR